LLSGAQHPCKWPPAIKPAFADRVRRDRRERPRHGSCELAPDHMDPGPGGRPHPAQEYQPSTGPVKGPRSFGHALRTRTTRAHRARSALAAGAHSIPEPKITGRVAALGLPGAQRLVKAR